MKNKVIAAIQTHRKLLADLESRQVDTIVEISTLISGCFKSGGRLYLCGNGGSAADCQHIAGELVGRFRLERKGLPAVALTTDTSTLTSVANDYGFDDVFRRQVEALVRQGDILWAFSTSGASKNILAAAESAKKIGAAIIAFTANADSPLEKLSDMCINVDGALTSEAQEIHQLTYHIICNLIEQQMCE